MDKVIIKTVRIAKPKYRSAASKSIHTSAAALLRVGAIDKETMRDFDATCLVKTPVFSAEQIKNIREKAKVSQPVFAVHHNTSDSTVQKWETGINKPRGAALKLLDVINKHGLAVLALSYP